MRTRFASVESENCRVESEMRIEFVRSCTWCSSKGPFMRTPTKFLVRDYICNNCDRKFTGLTVLGIRLSWKVPG